MRVLIHAPAARMGGALTHLLGVVPELAELALRDHFLLVAQPELFPRLPDLPERWELRPERAQARGTLRRLVWEQRELPRIAREWRADVLLSFGSFVPLRAPCPTVLEAGNALPFTRAYWLWVQRQSPLFQAEQVGRWLLLRASLRAAARVLAPTRAMRQDVVVRVPEIADRVDVVPWGVADVFHRATWRGSGSHRLVGVSKHGVNKEFDILVSALPRLVERWPDLQLELTGTPDESPWAGRTAALARQLGLKERVHFRGDLPNEAIPGLVAEASAVVFPTWCESFGLPLAEALAMGAPAVAGDIPACREVGGDAALYYHPGSADSLADRVSVLLAEPARAAELARAARPRGASFRWRDTAAGTLESLRRAATRPL